MLPEGMFLLKEERAVWPSSANVLLVRDGDGASLVDVGCGKEKTYAGLKDFISARGFSMEDVHTVVLTHAHPDHMGAMRYLLQEIKPRIFLHPVEIPLAAEPSRLNRTFDIELPFRYGIGEIPREEADIIKWFSSSCPMASAEATHSLSPGEELVLGGFDFQMVLTPGHARGLVSLFERKTGLLFTADAVGDVIAWYSPSSGGFTGFLEGLDRLSRLPAALLVPSHGDPNTRPMEEIERTRRRLLRREDRVLEELSSGPVAFPDLVLRLFKNPFLSFFPGCQMLQCHLDKLEAEGMVRCRGEEEGWLVELPRGRKTIPPVK